MRDMAVDVATDYLPTAIHAYLELPRDYADTKPLKDGKTARELPSDQLRLLSDQMNEVANAVNRNDADRLLAHGRFRGAVRQLRPNAGGEGPATGERTEDLSKRGRVPCGP